MHSVKIKTYFENACRVLKTNKEVVFVSFHGEVTVDGCRIAWRLGQSTRRINKVNGRSGRHHSSQQLDLSWQAGLVVFENETTWCSFDASNLCSCCSSRRRITITSGMHIIQSSVLTWQGLKPPRKAAEQIEPLRVMKNYAHYSYAELSNTNH